MVSTHFFRKGSPWISVCALTLTAKSDLQHLSGYGHPFACFILLSMPRLASILLLVTALILVLASRAPADDKDRSIELFEKHIRPTLVEHCLRCHGPKKQQGGLRIDTPEGLSKGGDSGAIITPGDPDESILIQAVRYEDIALEMPPRGKLPEKTIAAFEQWVRLGAADPRQPGKQPSTSGPTTPTVEEGRSFWAFQPIANPEPPSTAGSNWPRNEIDQFVLASLEANGLQPVRPANKETLARRVYVDLIGLPPTPEQTKNFVGDQTPNAYENLIDQLLGSKQFGQRWGRHWLDVVRYAESSGGGRTLLFPDAWRYRDYVIDSFNQDLPYDQFIQEQVAGDLMQPNDWLDQRRKLTATAFLLLGPTNYELQDKEVLESDIVDEQLDTMGKALMGMTIGCARCHDHKFDPIPTKDYYALAGILQSTRTVIHGNVSTWNKVDLPLPPHQQANLAAHLEKVKRLEDSLDKANKALKQLGGRKYFSNKSIPLETLSGVGIVLDDSAAKLHGEWMESTSIGPYIGSHYIHDKSERRGEKAATYQTHLPQPGQYEVRVSYTSGPNRSASVPVIVSHADGKTESKINQKKSAPIDGVFTSLGTFNFAADQQAQVTISNRGTDDGVVIADAVVFIRQGATQESNAKNAEQLEKDRRRKAKQAALEARVKQLKKDLDDLKSSGPKTQVAMAAADKPTPGDIPIAIRGVVHNPGEIVPRGFLQVASSRAQQTLPTDSSGRLELAQWLTNRSHPLTSRVMANHIWYWLVGEGLVTTVDNFGRTGRPPSHPELLDHLSSYLLDNDWSIKKLIRHIMLSQTYRMSSTTDALMHDRDPGNRWLWRMNRKRLRAEDIRDAMLFVSGELDLSLAGSSIKPGTKIEYDYVFDSVRRSVYVPVFRNTLPEIFEVFDFADPNIQLGKRNSSTIASQALWMMNSPFVLQQCESVASKQLALTEFDIQAVIQHAYYQVLSRQPSRRELQLAKSFLGTADKSELKRRLSMFYQTLFQCIDFRYLN